MSPYRSRSKIWDETIVKIVRVPTGYIETIIAISSIPKGSSVVVGKLRKGRVATIAMHVDRIDAWKSAVIFTTSLDQLLLRHYIHRSTRITAMQDMMFYSVLSFAFTGVCVHFSTNYSFATIHCSKLVLLTQRRIFILLICSFNLWSELTHSHLIDEWKSFCACHSSRDLPSALYH